MNIREVKVGRSHSCDICLAPECRYCSSVHAILYMDGQALMYRDCSRNGTYINNCKVHQRAVAIHHGDNIMLAGAYPLSWNSIDRFFPVNSQANEQAIQQPPNEKQKRTPDLGKFNWGAFFLYPIWGFFNGCWWAILFSWSGLLANILFGAFGTRIAWSNGKWEDADDFEQAQHSWTQWGVGIFLAILAFCILIGIVCAAIAASANT